MWTMLSVAMLSGAGLAVASSAHCAVMCGPLAVSVGARERSGSARYFAGRIVSYSLLGSVSGSAGRALTELMPARWLEAGLSWLIALALVLAAMRQLAPRHAPTVAAVRLTHKAKPRRLTPVSPVLECQKRRFLIDSRARPQVRPEVGPGTKAANRRKSGGFAAQKGRNGSLSRLLSLAASDPLLLGLASALLPCGALLAAVVAAAALGSPLAGALSMAAFGAVTSLALAGISIISHRALRLGHQARRLTGLVLLAGAALMVWRPLPRLGAEAGKQAPACHGTGEVQP